MGFSALGRSRVAGCFLGLAAELGCSSPGSSTRVLGGCLHHRLLPPRVAVPEQALASEFYFFFFFLRMLLCLAGIAGSVATLLHDAVMNPAEGNALCCRGSAAPC